jgi:hypothetical protein
MGSRRNYTRHTGVFDKARMYVSPSQFYNYGHVSYVLRLWLQVGFSPLNATPYQLLCIAQLGTFRVAAVEWSYKDV